MSPSRILAALLLAAAAAPAQSLKIYSEFQRIDPSGEVAAPDRGGEPREILSPALIRNAWNSFHLACTAAEGPAFLFIQQNPELFEVRVYREEFVDAIPDALVKVALPYTIPAQTTAVFWLDIRVPADAAPGRSRLQAVLKVGDGWMVYPMEVRVEAATAEGTPSAGGPLPPVTARADAVLLSLLRRRICGTPEAGQPSPMPTVRGMIRRNALQDLSLARYDLSAVLEESGYPLRTLCGAVPPEPPEWWLQVRRVPPVPQAGTNRFLRSRLGTDFRAATIGSGRQAYNPVLPSD